MTQKQFSFGIDGINAHDEEGVLFILINYDEHPDEHFEGTFEQLLEWCRSYDGEGIAGDCPVRQVYLDIDEIDLSDKDINDIIDMFDSFGINVEISQFSEY